MKNLLILFISLFILQSHSSPKVQKTCRFINTIPNYTKVYFCIYQNFFSDTYDCLMTFQGLWDDSYWTTSLDPQLPLYINSNDSSISTQIIQNISQLPDRFSIIIYEDLLETKPAFFVKADDFKRIKGSDQARWYIINLSKKMPNLNLYTQTSDCYKCLNIFTSEFQYLSNKSQIESFISLTTHQFFIYFSETPTEKFPTFQIKINENGVYTYFLLDSPNSPFLEIKEIIDSDPDLAYIPLIIALFIIICLCIIRVLFYHFYNKYKIKEKNASNEDLQPLNVLLQSSEEEIQKKKTPSSRVESLDLFRGIALTVMIFVNYGGGNYWFFSHSTWNGLTVPDLVFPFFIWIMGTSMALSFDKLQKSKPTKNFSHLDFIYKIVRRSIILFLLGMFINNGYDLDNWRIPGVLQRFGVCYLLIALIVSYIPKLDIQFLKPLKDILDYLYQWLLVLAVLLAYLLITYASKLEGCPRGYTGPGGLADYGQYWDCTGGIALYLDKKIFGESHIYHEPTSLSVYHTGMFDPEGFLGNLTSLFLTFTGYQCGRILINYKNDKDKLIRWVVWGVVLATIGTGLCGASKNEGVVPLNKNIWSISFVLVLGGLAFLCIAVCYVIVDMKKWWLGWPFIYVGRNSIVIYLGHEILEGFFPFSFKNDGDHCMALLCHCVGVGCWLWIAWRMNEEKVFIKV